MAEKVPRMVITVLTCGRLKAVRMHGGCLQQSMNTVMLYHVTGHFT
jgi:hypothetical protein